MQIGARVGAYEVIAKLGEGGMGVVYKALDLRLQRHVALKMLPATLSLDHERRRRFLQEARAASALNDPHIVVVYDILEHDGVDVLVMELIDGQTLQEAARTPISTEQAVDVVTQVADAMAVAHGAGIVHRDLKPSNIMVTPRGVKVLDFGIAKVGLASFATTLAAITMPGDVMGTAAYMSPEQARGGAVDHRTDIYSLAAILHELLSAGGRRVPPRLAAVISCGLQRDPAERFPSMTDFAAAVRTAAASSPGAWRRPALLAGGLAGIAAAAVAGWLWFGAMGGVTPNRGTPSTMPTAAAVEMPADALAHTQIGLGLLQRFDRPANVDRAIASFEAAIALDGSYAPAWAALAQAYWRQQRLTRDKTWAARAVDTARRAVALDESLAGAHVALGLALVDAGQHAEGQEHLRRALLLEPTNADAHRGLGDSLAALDDRDGAATEYQEAQRLRPDDWELCWLVGNIDYRAGRYAAALEWYQRAVAAGPDVATPHQVEGAAHHMLGDYASAAAALQRAIAIQASAPGYSNLGTALFFQGRYSESVNAFTRAVELRPNDALTWANLGDALRWTPGRRAEAPDAYRRAIQILEQELTADPQNITSRSRLALYLAKAGDVDRAQEQLARIPALADRDVNVLYRAAVTAELSGDRGRALEWLGRALAAGYPMHEVQTNPELTALRTDVRYHQLAVKFDSRSPG